jgi:hypothetical protein
MPMGPRVRVAGQFGFGPSTKELRELLAKKEQIDARIKGFAQIVQTDPLPAFTSVQLASPDVQGRVE